MNHMKYQNNHADNQDNTVLMCPDVLPQDGFLDHADRPVHEVDELFGEPLDPRCPETEQERGTMGLVSSHIPQEGGQEATQAGAAPM